MADFSSTKGILKKFNPAQDRYISREFQKYAYDLAVELNDLEHRAIYMRLAKTIPRHILEKARYYIRDAGNIKTPAKLYMWKVKQLRDELKAKDKRKQEK